MAVEKMRMMNLAMLKKDAHDILEEIVLDGSFHITNSSNSPNFTLRYMDSQISKFREMGIDIGRVLPYNGDKIFKKKKYKDLLEQMFEFFEINEENLKLETFKYVDYHEKLKVLDELSQKMLEIKNREEANRFSRSKIKILLKAVKYFNDSDVNVSRFTNLHHINMDIGEISKSAWMKLKANYENIKALVIHLDSNSFGETVMVFTPKIYEDDTLHLLRSMSFNEIEFPNVDFSFKDLISSKMIQLNDLEKEQDEIKKEKEVFKETYMQEILSLYYRYKIIEKIEIVESHMVMSKNFAMLSGFVPESKTALLKSKIEKISSDAIVMFNDSEDVPEMFKIPTMLRNNTIIRPFEALVKMYSVPNYKELDPTPFFALTYLILFGMMFGDIGQGLVFVIAGTLLTSKIGSIAKIVQRIGISSMIFGVFYGSIFGMEELIPALLIRPMENINTILLVSIGIGVVFMTISYFIGFYNLKLRKEYAKLYFDKNGIAGFVFYIGFLLLLVNIAYLGGKVDVNVSSMLTIISVAMMIITSVFMFMKPKLAEKFEENSPTDSVHKEEFSPVESGFELFETVMGFFSNTLSFIRVGAFAINHVGLFMAFHALGQMIGNSIGNVLMIVLGNIVILVLEGLIVFIQAIRLQYYELFSKYFTGEGIDYDPIHVEIKSENN
ncbi:V-type ATPase 116kDa subunit family protein [[Eubacterium] yurii subsp. margaretiae ATCC 43715]|nr:V-type ATPase 116kDa subunit family protein [[Eubacterium] yurii subsp. margaretiae ATCC 43715]